MFGAIKSLFDGERRFTFTFAVLRVIILSKSALVIGNRGITYDKTWPLIKAILGIVALHVCALFIVESLACQTVWYARRDLSNAIKWSVVP